jgi:hypothetical protein
VGVQAACAAAKKAEQKTPGPLVAGRLATKSALLAAGCSKRCAAGCLFASRQCCNAETWAGLGGVRQPHAA